MAQVSATLVKQLRDQTGAGMMDCKTALQESDGDLEAANDWLRKKGLAAAAKKAGRVAAEGLIGLAGAPTRAALVEVNSETDFVARNEEFQALVREIAAIAPEAGGDLERLRDMILPSAGQSVAEAINEAIGRIGENLSLRRTDTLAVEHGAIGTYVHSALAPGLGKIGVLVGLQSTGDPDGLAALGKQLAMHVAAARPLAVSADKVDPATVERERAIFIEQARATGKPENVLGKIVEGRMRKFFEEQVLLEQTFVVDPDVKVKDAIDRVAERTGSSIMVTGFVRYGLGEGLEKKTSSLAEEVAAQLDDH
jgi:elongation factor Ts